MYICIYIYTYNIYIDLFIGLARRTLRDAARRITRALELGLGLGYIYIYIHIILSLHLVVRALGFVNREVVGQELAHI